MRKKIFFILGFVLLLIALIIYGNRGSREEREHMEYMRRKANYGSDLSFTMPGRDGFSANTGAHLRRNRENPDEEDYIDVIFVHNASEAENFPNNILVAWPSEDVYWEEEGRYVNMTNFRLGEINTTLHYDFPDVDLRDYGLSENRITLFDIVENWEIVDEIMENYIRR